MDEKILLTKEMNAKNLLVLLRELYYTFTPWFISNGTVQKTDLSADADVLAKIFVWQPTYGTMECIYV